MKFRTIFHSEAKSFQRKMQLKLPLLMKQLGKDYENLILK